MWLKEHDFIVFLYAKCQLLSSNYLDGPHMMQAAWSLEFSVVMVPRLLERHATAIGDSLTLNNIS